MKGLPTFRKELNPEGKPRWVTRGPHSFKHKDILKAAGFDYDPVRKVCQTLDPNAVTIARAAIKARLKGKPNEILESISDHSRDSRTDSASGPTDLQTYEPTDLYALRCAGLDGDDEELPYTSDQKSA